MEFVVFPFLVNDRYYGQLAHRMFLHTLKTTTHVYLHLWGLKEICHDPLEPIRTG